MELVLGSRKESHWVPLMVTNSVRLMALKTELRLVQPKELHLAIEMEKNCNNKNQIRRPGARTIYRHTKTSVKHTLADPMELVLGSRKESHWVPPMVTNSVQLMANPKVHYLEPETANSRVNYSDPVKASLKEKHLEQVTVMLRARHSVMQRANSKGQYLVVEMATPRERGSGLRLAHYLERH
jgi:hypothetical protein